MWHLPKCPIPTRKKWLKLKRTNFTIKGRPIEYLTKRFFSHFGRDFDRVVVKLNEKKIIMNAETQTVEFCETVELSDNTEVNHED